MSDGKRVLYIDDNQDHLMIVQAMLKRDGYDCVIHTDAQSGLEAALNEVYDLILLDIQMPKISGIDLLKQLKQRQSEIGFRIVAITADSSAFSRQNPYSVGFDGYLSKPILPPDLSRMVKQVLAASTD